jgi:hypothetical protein
MPDLPSVLKAVHDVLTPDGLFFLGQYGGIEFQGVRAQDHYEPKRYFSFLPDGQLRALIEVDFWIHVFKVVELPDEEDSLRRRRIWLFSGGTAALPRRLCPGNEQRGYSRRY